MIGDKYSRFQVYGYPGRGRRLAKRKEHAQEFERRDKQSFRKWRRRKEEEERGVRKDY